MWYEMYVKWTLIHVGSWSVLVLVRFEVRLGYEYLGRNSKFKNKIKKKRIIETQVKIIDMPTLSNLHDNVVGHLIRHYDEVSEVEKICREGSTPWRQSSKKP